MGGSKEDTLEAARKSVVSCAKMGKTLVYSMGKLRKDLANDYKSNDFPTDKIFDWAEWRKPDNHMKLVRDDENEDISGNSGQYIMMDKFTICLLYDYVDDADIQAVKSSVPHGDKFLTYIVQ